MRACTNPGDLVLDPFLGSGTTALAALRLRRGFRGIEIDQKWIDLAKKRLNDEIGLGHKPTSIANRRTLKLVSASRRGS